MEMFTATTLEVFPPDCYDYWVADMGHPCFLLSVWHLLKGGWGSCFSGNTSIWVLRDKKIICNSIKIESVWNLLGVCSQIIVELTDDRDGKGAVSLISGAISSNIGNGLLSNWKQLGRSVHRLHLYSHLDEKSNHQKVTPWLINH